MVIRGIIQTCVVHRDGQMDIDKNCERKASDFDQNFSPQYAIPKGNFFVKMVDTEL